MSLLYCKFLCCLSYFPVYFISFTRQRLNNNSPKRNIFSLDSWSLQKQEPNIEIFLKVKTTTMKKESALKKKKMSGHVILRLKRGLGLNSVKATRYLMNFIYKSNLKIM